MNSYLSINSDRAIYLVQAWLKNLVLSDPFTKEEELDLDKITGLSHKERDQVVSFITLLKYKRIKDKEKDQQVQNI